MLGIENYNPSFSSNTTDIIIELGQELKNLIGKKILDIWLVWETNEDEWFKDCPVVLNIEGMQLELCTTKIDELSITFNMIDMSKELNWYHIDDFQLEWRKEPLSDLLTVINKKIINVELIEYNFQTEITFSKDSLNSVGQRSSTWVLNGIGFELEDGYFSVFNGLDENEISMRREISDNIRTFKISNG
jgi:hypothetical protein